jgi:uncharacterized damage-inducible protein DinB
MRRIIQSGILLFCIVISSLALAQAAKEHAKEQESEKEGKKQVEVGEVLTGGIIQLRRTMLPVALAMPEDKFAYAPTSGEFKGVRTFAQQLKHVGAANYLFASSILGEKPPAEVGEDEAGPASLKSKDEIIKYVTESFAYVLKAVDTIDEKNVVAPIDNPFGKGTTTRLAMATLIVGHCYDHYGQMVEYLRMNGITPPASMH